MAKACGGEGGGGELGPTEFRGLRFAADSRPLNLVDERRTLLALSKRQDHRLKVFNADASLVRTSRAEKDWGTAGREWWGM
mgnify:FL=1